MTATNRIKNYLHQTVSAAPLAVFRVFFGLLMIISLLRFWANGWIEKLYLEPNFHFTYYGFDWVQPLGFATYLLFVVGILSSIAIVLGYKHRLAMLLLFLSFTYIELIDKTTYLNHYYFVSCLSFLMLFLPLSASFSLDALKKGVRTVRVPRWNIDAIKVFLAIVYIYAGLAKLNSDWLIEAMPLKIWLPSKYNLPILGDLMQESWVHYGFSYAGALYDLLIPFFLWNKKTRGWAFVAVVVFHLLTRALFPIGMFPYIMIVSTLIFFSADFHQKLISNIKKVLVYLKIRITKLPESRVAQRSAKFSVFVVGFFLLIQLVFPWRYALYPDELFWTEEGYRFSWRVMLMEKAGYAQFKVVDGKTGKSFAVDNSDFLTPFQEKQMSYQPDFILQYAHYLADHYSKKGYEQVKVYVESYVALNGRLSQPFINPKVDLVQQQESFAHKTWILPFNDTIHGF